MRPEAEPAVDNAAGSKPLADPELVPQLRTKKKSGARGGPAVEIAEAAPDDYVRVIPYKKPVVDPDFNQGIVTLSRLDAAAQLQFSPDKLSVTGHKGFRTARATHGAYKGTWYCEVTATSLGSSGHCRLGWSTKKGQLQAPVGYDKHGFSYRDVDGSKVHQGLRQAYGAAYGEGDVVGMLIHLPEGGKCMEKGADKLVRYKGTIWVVDEPEEKPQQLLGSQIAFTKNGIFQGAAFQDFDEGTYYPAVSLYTLPEQSEGATVTINFGPNFRFPPPTEQCFSAARPVSDLAQHPQQQQPQVYEPADEDDKTDGADQNDAGMAGALPGDN